MQKERISVIVTSAGTASAISVIKALKEQHEFEIKIIAVDVDPMAAGLFLADESAIVPAVTSADYISSLIKLSAKTGAKILIPIYSKEIRLISENSQYLKGHGIHTLLSSFEIIELVNDKSAMHNAVTNLGIRTPYLYTKKELQQIDSSSLPLFAKPNTGSSSSGTEKISSISRLNELIADSEDLIIQSFIDADEVTVDVLCDNSSNAIVIAPRLRLATKSGQSVKGRTISNNIFIKPVQIICNALKIKGVCNIQFFLKDNELTFIELNPRFAAGGLMLTVGAGANIPLLLLKLILGVQINKNECLARPGIEMTRYWQEIIINKPLN
ncbi:MAG: ATP-grasp domain-containing protein [Bacteroidia bacterium]|jgi:carbamoyl-phosphate synthase large subunit